MKYALHGLLLAGALYVPYSANAEDTQATKGARQLTLLGQTVGVPIREGTWSTIPFDLEKRDDADLHSGSDSKIVFRKSGTYRIDAFVTRDTTANANLGIRVLRNGQQAWEYWSAMGSIEVKQARPITVVDNFAAGDFVEIQMFAIVSAGDDVLTIPASTFFSAEKL